MAWSKSVAFAAAILTGNTFLQLGTILQVYVRVVQGKDTCDDSTDSCDSKYDDNCDEGRSCAFGTDCFDCDPCRQYDRTSCSKCTSGGCGWCNQDAICSSQPINLKDSSFDSNCAAEDFVTSCTEIDEQACYDYWREDINGEGGRACPWYRRFNSKCNEPPDTDTDTDNNAKYACQANTDCFDCSKDPCRQYDFTSCAECTSFNKDCLWCGQDTICSNKPFSKEFFQEFGENTWCQEDDYVSTCNDETNTNANINTNIFNDPLYDGQSWVYRLIRVEPVWGSGITGAGIHIRINDRGVEANHSEFAGRFDVEASCQDYAPLSDNDHGTKCAAIAAASADNGLCSAGIAPDASVSACRITGTVDSVTPENEGNLFISHFLERLDVSSNSWGVDACNRNELPHNRRLFLEESDCMFDKEAEGSPCTHSACSGEDYSISECESVIVKYCSSRYKNDSTPCLEYLDRFVSCEYNTLSETARNELTKGITMGRGGKGVIYVFASGNALQRGEDTNHEGWLNTRFTIAVGAVGHLGKHTIYSTPGAALFCTAPGGDYDFIRNMAVATFNGTCGDSGQGTSYSTPVVSGVVALMLQANLELTWRDVQGILALTSQMVNPEDASWFINAAGFHHSNKYGFGMVDAKEAVNAANAWENYAEEQQIFAEPGTINIVIPDDPLVEVSSTLTLIHSNDNGTANFATESVAVYLDLHHPSRGNLNIVLTSPSGTESLLHPGKRPESTVLKDDERWKLMTVRAWGEDGNGDWKLSFNDQKEGDVSHCVDNPNWVVYTTDNPGWEMYSEVDIINCRYMVEEDKCDGTGKGSSWKSYDGELEQWWDRNNVTPDKACCACGGGTFRDPSEFSDTLVSWKIIVYGHEVPIAPSASPTLSLAPSLSPVMITSNTAIVPTRSGAMQLELHTALTLVVIVLIAI